MVKDSGYTISLIAVNSGSDRMTVTFRIQPAPTNKNAEFSHFGGITPLDVTLNGTSWSNDNSAELRIIDDRSVTPPQVSAFEDTIYLAPTQDSSQPVEVTINTLRFDSSSPDQRMQILKGTWDFRFTPAALVQLPSKHLTVGKDTTSEGVTFVLDSIDQSSTQTVVTYHTATNTPEKLAKTNIVAKLPDGSIVGPDQNQEADGGNVATFASLPADGTVTFALEPMLVEIPRPVDLSLPIDGRIVAAGQAGQPIPLSIDRAVDGESMAIPAITPLRNAFEIRVANNQPNHSGRVLLYMPGTEVTLKDNLGNSYNIMGAASNFGKSDLLTMWADGSTLTFQGVLAQGATELTLHVQSFARQLRGPWQIDVQLPDLGNE